MATVPESGNLTLIFPNGKLTRTVEEYREFHVQWFGDPDWSVTYEVISQIEGADLAFVSLLARNQDKNAKGENIAYSLILTLVFQKQTHGWKLISDQNTMVRD